MWFDGVRFTYRVTVSGSGNVFNYIYNAISDVFEMNKFALVYSENNFSAWFNGVKVSENLSGVTFPIGTLDNISFDGGTGTTDKFQGKTKQIKVFKRALSDQELIELTSN